MSVRGRSAIPTDRPSSIQKPTPKRVRPQEHGDEHDRAEPERHRSARGRWIAPAGHRREVAADTAMGLRLVVLASRRPETHCPARRPWEAAGRARLRGAREAGAGVRARRRAGRCRRRAAAGAATRRRPGP